jgi:hypothetical protein
MKLVGGRPTLALVQAVATSVVPAQPRSAPPKARTAAKSSRKPKKREILSRYGTVRGWDADAFLLSQTNLGPSARRMLSLKLFGDLAEPVGPFATFELWLALEREHIDSPVAAVGALTGMTHALGAHVGMPPVEFQFATTLAASGRLKSVHLSFEKPRYGRGLVLSASISTEMPDEGQ